MKNPWLLIGNAFQAKESKTSAEIPAKQLECGIVNHDMMTSDARSCSLGSRSSFLSCTLEAPEANLKPEIPARIPLWASKEVAKSCMFFPSWMQLLHICMMSMLWRHLSIFGCKCVFNSFSSFRSSVQHSVIYQSQGGTVPADGRNSVRCPCMWDKRTKKSSWHGGIKKWREEIPMVQPMMLTENEGLP